MKVSVRTLSLLLTLALTVSLFPQWTAQTSGITDRIRMVRAVNATTLWACAGAGKVLRTTDGGTTWTLCTVTNAGSTNYAIYPMSATVAYVTGTVGGSADYSIWKTTDAGVTWVSQANNPNGFGDGLEFFNTNDGVFIGDPDPYPSTYWEILTTSNGGTNWTRVGRGSIPAADSVNSEAGSACATAVIGNTIWFTGYTAVAGTPNNIYKSTNKGATWTKSTITPFSGTSGSNYIAFADANNGVAVALDGTTATTVNGGTTWTASNVTGAAFRYVVNLKGSSRYIAVGNTGKVWISYNAGAAWSELTGTGITDNLYTACEVNGIVWAAGNTGKIIKWSGPNLPVEFTAFNANVSGNNVNLSWSTATEKNNRGYEVQRKGEDGNYITVKFIQGAGTTTEARSYNFTDAGVLVGKYSYRLKQLDFNGDYNYSKEVEVDVVTPAEYALGQNYPNPFNPTTQIAYQLKNDGMVSLRVYNQVGAEVAVLANGFQKSGKYTVAFDAASLPSGIYYYTIVTPGFTSAKKMMLIK